MHPPSFRANQQLSEWPGCWLELICRSCGGRSVTYPVKLLINKYGDTSFDSVLGKLKCSVCHRPPAPVYLCATPHRKGGHGGPAPDWAVELCPEPSSMPT